MALQTFDQEYYLSNNPDVLTAVLNGVFTSAEQHYMLFGEKEGRMPSAFFDPMGYFAQNPDVLAAVQAGVFSTGLAHFEMHGAAEDRTPGNIQFNEAYYLEQNPDVKAAVEAGTFTSGYQHFVLYGAAEGRAPADGVQPGTPGDTFALTAGNDNLVGTPNDDFFRAPAGTMQDSDVVDGGAGTDTLAGVAANAPFIKNVEIFNLTGALDMGFVSGAQQVWADGGALTLTNASLGPVFGLKGAAPTQTIDFGTTNLTGTADTLKVAVMDPGAPAVINSAQQANIEGLTVTASGAAGSGTTGTAADDVLDATAFDALETVTVTGAGNTEVQLGSADLATVDTSGATGRMTVDGSASTEDMTMTGGSGATTFTGGGGDDAITTGDGKDTLNGGAGDDTLTSGAGADTLDGGAGDDTLIGGAGADTMTGGAGKDKFVVETANTLLGSQDSVMNFVAADDTLTFGGAAGSAANYAEGPAVLNSFTSAREQANNLLDGTVIYAAVDINGDGLNGSLVFFDADADGTADQVVNLSGVGVGAYDHTVIVA